MTIYTHINTNYTSSKLGQCYYEALEVLIYNVHSAGESDHLTRCFGI